MAVKRKHDIIGKCPVCESELTISELKCEKCGTIIKNDFRISPFLKLDKEEEFLLLTFVKYMGNLSEISKELGISYPTLKNRLENLKLKLGIETGDSTDRIEILNKIDEGKLSVEQALKLLNK